jgi:hypothetical protein
MVKDKNFMNYMAHKIKCPVPNCKGFETCSSQANVGNHIRNKAKTELLKNYILGDKYETPHAKYLKNACQKEVAEKTAMVFKVDGRQFIITG